MQVAVMSSLFIEQAEKGCFEYVVKIMLSLQRDQALRVQFSSVQFDSSKCKNELLKNAL